MSTTTSTRTPWSRLRMRQTAHLRDLSAETTFTTAHLIQPLFVVEDLDAPQPIPGLGDNARLGPAAAAETAARDVQAGVRHFLLFPVPAAKHARGRSPHGARAAEAVKRAVGDAAHVWVDVCLCASTETGHCALVDARGRIDLDATLEALAASAVSMAEAGADGVSPSDMMDGRTARIRAALNEAGHGHVPIMSYSTKFASQMYGPFREAADSAPQFGDRRHYQIDVRSRTDAIASSRRCAAEGADLLMVKPGMSSIDLIGPIRDATGMPVGAYQVSGEYAGLTLLAERGLTNFDAALLETWHVFRRAGAAYLITYGARQAHRLGVPA
ncbi:MAG TPA: porphobilinogen synthase [Vicinamibacterales bacterium]|nr:porphobilinogen synthase [Vicinamibacterales bacterium]